MKSSDSDQGMDTEIITNIAIVSGSKEALSCSYGYSVVKASSGCSDYGCDLNMSAGGSYMYLCVKKQKYSSLGSDDKIINKVGFVYNSKDCGNLNMVSDKDLNESAGGDYIYMCAGEDSTQTDRSPIDDLYLYIKNVTPAAPSDYTCLTDQDLNKGAGGKDIFLCYHKAQKIPKSVSYSNLIMDYSNEEITLDGNPSEVATIQNDNGSGNTASNIKRTVANTKISTYSWNVEETWGLKTEVKATYGPPVLQTWKVSLTINTEFNWSSSEGGSKTTTDTEQIDYTCNAPAGRGYKCTAFVQNYKVNIPYKVDRTVTNYDGTKSKVTLSSKFTGTSASNIQFTRCCYSKCDSTENICSDADTDSGICPSVESSSSMPTTSTETMTLKYNPVVITEVKAVNSSKKTTSCPMGYQIVNSGCDSQGCDLNYKAGGDYVYLCLKKQNLQDIIGSSQPINSYRVQIENDSCGSLKGAGVDLNKGAGGKYIYLCTGNDSSLNESPIVDIFVWIKGVNSAPSGYTCDSNDLNMNAGGNYIYLCYKRDDSVPKTININNISYDYTGLKQLQIGTPNKIDEITVSSGTLSKTIKSVVKSEKSWKKSFDFGVSVGVNLTIGDLKSMGKELSMTVTGSYKYSKSEEWKEADEKTVSTQVDCIAEDRKTIKCYSYNTNVKVDVPYTADITYLNYKGSVMSKDKFSGWFEAVTATDIKFKTCCVDGQGCCTGYAEKDFDKPQCKTLKKDVLCSELSQCFK
jgi:hypothetical protein